MGYEHPDAVALIAMVQAEYVARYGGEDFSPIGPADFDGEHGAFFVGYADDEPVATGAWRRSGVPQLGTDRTAEIKRMYVIPAAQRRGFARQMLSHLESDARGAGFEAIILETGRMQPEAIALYESSGYVAVPGFGTYACYEESRHFGKRLEDLEDQAS